LHQYCTQKNVEIVKQVPNMPDRYILSTKNVQFSTIELSNAFYESNFFANVDPAFMFNFTNGSEATDSNNTDTPLEDGTLNCANDPNFVGQWGLNNIGARWYDVNACAVWGITEGSGIKIAVFDTGIELTHNDLSANIHSLSYNAETGMSPSIAGAGGGHGTKAAQLLEAVGDEKEKIVKGNQALINNISFDANEIGTLYLEFNFLIRELTDKSNFAYHLIQRESSTGIVIGGETIIINKNPRPIFIATAPAAQAALEENIIIAATDINEPAIYNWYNEAGVLVHEGKYLYVESAVDQVYQLEVVATSDGYKDMATVPINIKPSTIESLAPNPASDNGQISYKLNTAQPAYIMIIGTYMSNAAATNYVLDRNETAINLDMSNYPTGFTPRHWLLMV